MDPAEIVPNPATTASSMPPDAPAQTVDPAVAAEIKKLRAQLFGTEDPVTQAAIEGRLTQLGAMPKPVADQSEPEDELPSPPTNEALHHAERMIREARVEKMRGSPQKALEMVKEAAVLAPGSAMVQEALGDDLSARSRLEEAKKAYRLAVRLDPTNVGVERKHAALVAKMGGMGNIDEQLRAALSDSFLPESAESLASGPALILFSGILPGLGQLLAGKVAIGATLLSSWIIAGIWLTIMREDLARLAGTGKGNMIVAVPLFIMVVTWIAAVQSASSMSKRRTKKHVDRPMPPVDMKFD